MKLNDSQIRAVTSGAATVTKEADGIHFCRFTDWQAELYRTVHPDFYYKVPATANVRLDFVTDSKTLSVGVIYSKASSRRFGFTDVFCNGKAIAHVGTDAIAEGLYEKTLDLGDGEKTIRIQLPWSVKTVLADLSLDDGATVIPVKKERKMLIFGDSITQGYDAKYPSASYAAILADRLCADARNKGIGGEKFFPALVERPESDGFAPDLITVAYGTNDWAGLESPERLELPMRAFYTKLCELYPAVPVFALAPIWRCDENDGIHPTGPFSVVEEMLRRTAQNLPTVTVIPCYDFVPHDPAFFTDIHPNDLGFASYADRLLSAISPLL